MAQVARSSSCSLHVEENWKKRMFLLQREARRARVLVAAVAAVIVCFSGMVSADPGAIYSNMRQETELNTYDCVGYTVRIVGNAEGQIEVYFTDHEGNCSIEGQRAQEVDYYQKEGILSFTVPFYATEHRGVSVAYYRFKGRIFKDRVEGQLSIEYPSHPGFNKIGKLTLWKTTEKKLFKNTEKEKH